MVIRATVALFISTFLTPVLSAEGFSTELRNLGYSLIPAPQRVEVSGEKVVLDSSWGVSCELGDENIAVRSLRKGAKQLHSLVFDGTGQQSISLRVSAGTVTAIEEPERAVQAYQLSITLGGVEIVGNGEAGLFYGVQSLLQLLRADGTGNWSLPVGTIQDWPALQLRFVHWDTKHHQDRLETLKRYLDLAAFFKANAIGFEIEDKYEYPSHPIVGAPGAYTKAEIQELTAYALERYIQLVPQIQSPAHMAYVLKHEQFAHLQADGSNYQACMCDEEALDLMRDLYQDMIEATPGVDYFHVSTDEVYFAGICPKCQQQRPFNDENRSLTWVDFVNEMHAWLTERDRTMLCWVENPLHTEHIHLLPDGLINGVMMPRRDSHWIRESNKAGIKSLVYNSQQGAELLFPNYFPSNHLYRGRPIQGRLNAASQVVSGTIETGANLVGTFAAAWDDSGLHCETFWLGWATVAQYGWTPEWPRVEQSTADFMDVFYGPGNQDMGDIYRTVMEGARFYESSLDRVPATRLKPTYGGWGGKGRDTTRIDFTLELPAVPFSYDENLIAETRFSRLYATTLEKAPAMNRRLDQVIAALQGKLGTVTRNRYSVEVLLSIAQFEKHFVEMLLSLQQTEKILIRAAEALRSGENREALTTLVGAHARVRRILQDRSEMWQSLKSVWEKSQHPKGRSVDGRHFVHILDDLKDHRADRRAGLEYMLEPLENAGLEEWNQKLASYIRTFAISREFEVPEL